MILTEQQIRIKAHSINELSRQYGVSRRTFIKWLQPHLTAIGQRIGNFYTPVQVGVIYDKLGVPGMLKSL